MTDKQLLFTVGRIFSPLYSLAMILREYLYSKGVIKSTKLEVPVISVGNLTMGGSGKTPLVAHIARMLLQNGRRPAIISRGYGGAAREPVNIVSDGKNLLLDARSAGDEPRLLAESLPGVPVLTGRVRKLPARRAIDMGADVLILDDGFQHLALKRDLDLVLFHADTLAGNSRVFPGGDLREPVKALHRCHAFIITYVCPRNRERADRFATLLGERFPGKPIFFTSHSLEGLVHRSATGNLVPEEGPLSGKIYGFCAIAQPESFHQTLLDLDPEMVGFESFTDHYAYREKDISKICGRALEKGANALVVTEKDLVKLGDIASELPLYALRSGLKVERGFSNFIGRMTGLFTD
ncbi:MAG: tetraacyldisaccharide 4'-kinase [Desulfobulbaceae bacterium]|nr:tetraacyldisaccharide 4'-kinase [Desulfobulbaceae bacterium]